MSASGVRLGHPVRLPSRSWLIDELLSASVLRVPRLACSIPRGFDARPTLYGASGVRIYRLVCVGQACFVLVVHAASACLIRPSYVDNPSEPGEPRP